ncbi:unnamed protein product [Nippostrongylus brasiliensis]|uniref:Uncharacterized protein n=1 Tax=Nippostrongylus brasiliensis TaxID=27835 RepID=A0A0N4XNQ1_NIPBR|nr:unnamed protein product [Nippostrongylus brasiliensis]
MYNESRPCCYRLGGRGSSSSGGTPVVSVRKGDDQQRHRVLLQSVPLCALDSTGDELQRRGLIEGQQSA